MARNAFTKIDGLADELGTAESHRQELAQDIADLEEELTALDKMADEATDRDEFDAITAQREEARLDVRFARNRLNLFDKSPRIDPEVVADLLGQLSAEADDAAMRYRKKVEKPRADIVAAGDEFGQTIGAIREAVRKLASVDGPVTERDATLRLMFSRFELGKLRARAYADGSIVYPGLRDSLRLAATAKQEPFNIS